MFKCIKEGSKSDGGGRKEHGRGWMEEGGGGERLVREATCLSVLSREEWWGRQEGAWEGVGVGENDL